MNALETYLSDLYEIRSSGGAVKETSGYPALSVLLNEIGKTLKPRVRCVINLQNQGAGLPDGGLYSAEQYQKRGKNEPLEGQLPARGCIEVKAPHHAGRYNAFWYSLDLFLPIIKLGEADVWTPKDNRRWANLYRKVHIIIGSLFVPIGLAA